MTRDEIINIETESKPVVETKVIRVPMPTFPPTAMVYSVNKLSDTEEKPRPDTAVPMTLIAKVLTQPEPKWKPKRTYICTKCKCDIVCYEKATQVDCVYSHNGSTSAGVYHSLQRPRLDSTETEIN